GQPVAGLDQRVAPLVAGVLEVHREAAALAEARDRRRRQDEDLSIADLPEMRRSTLLNRGSRKPGITALVEILQPHEPHRRILATGAEAEAERHEDALNGILLLVEII